MSATINLFSVVCVCVRAQHAYFDVLSVSAQVFHSTIKSGVHLICTLSALMLGWQLSSIRPHPTMHHVGNVYSH